MVTLCIYNCFISRYKWRVEYIDEAGSAGIEINWLTDFDDGTYNVAVQLNDTTLHNDVMLRVYTGWHIHVTIKKYAVAYWEVAVGI